MMMKKQFLLDALLEQIGNSESFRKIMEDGLVTEQELAQQADRVNSLISTIEDKFSAEDFALVSELITELSVFYTITKFNEKV